ncbi:MAG: hypothetical protein JWO54_377 [Candidatus Saccharibacteria bacterium]|nr:hypothetical protein [Candidatus Saccharibacteria bacterium]MDB5180619.1 hypothetical protein [Candidatus Saccharibacteria bacterium]
MNASELKVNVSDWLDSVIEAYKKANPKQEIRIEGHKSNYGKSGNLIAIAPADATIFIPIYENRYVENAYTGKGSMQSLLVREEKIEVKAGWGVTVYRAYGSCQKGLSIATIYADGDKQITIRKGVASKRFTGS